MDINQVVLAIIPHLFELLGIIATGFISIMAIKINKKISASKKTNDDTNEIVNSSLELKLKNTLDEASKVAQHSQSIGSLEDAMNAKEAYDAHIFKRNS